MRVKSASSLAPLSLQLPLLPIKNVTTHTQSERERERDGGGGDACELQHQVVTGSGRWQLPVGSLWQLAGVVWQLQLYLSFPNKLA